ncbi:MAG: hypothetical protein U0264_01805 [Candidatus Kapaibacterium sp.]
MVAKLGSSAQASLSTWQANFTHSLVLNNRLNFASNRLEQLQNKANIFNALQGKNIFVGIGMFCFCMWSGLVMFGVKFLGINVIVILINNQSNNEYFQIESLRYK